VGKIHRGRGSWSLPIAGLLLLAARPGLAQDPPSVQDEEARERRARLARLSLEELMNLEVTSVSRKVEPLMRAASAVSVIRGDDLRRTGVRSIAEALRMVPGMQVARIDASKWAISSRGFGDRFANKMQVLVDGRSVYSDLFSGVFWEVQDTMLEDIERIEVIRGPGATVWGSNAVNGVVNVITKRAKDTQGGLVLAGAGSEERGFAAARYGAAAGDDVFVRVFAKYFDRDEAHEGHDDWFMARAGFRGEWTPSDRETLTVLGEAYDGETHGRIAVPIPVAPFIALPVDRYDLSGGHVVARWERRLSDTADVSAQASFDRSVWKCLPVGEIRDTVHLDVRHRSRPLEAHDVVWGVSYRMTHDDIDESPTVAFDPEEKTLQTVQVFLQDEIAAVDDVLSVTLGSKFEYHPRTGLEVQPGVRVSLRPHERHVLWASASRAVRTPARFEDDITTVQAFLGGAPPVPVTFVGDRDLRSEELLAFEAGYRVLPFDSLALDVAAFYNVYDHLRSNEPQPPTFTVIAPGNLMEARTYGVEPALTWYVAEGVTLRGWYALLVRHFEEDSDSLDPETDDLREKRNPRNQAYARLSLDPLPDVEVDVVGRYVDSIPGHDIDSYVELDARIGWRPLPRLELSLVGQNLLHDEHFEAASSAAGEQATEVERGFYLSVSWRF
jgi:iron complex outermembrane receptor protein